MDKTILVADDDPAIVDAIEIILEEEGYNVTTADATNILPSLSHQRRPDLVLLDIRMSGEDGREICKRIKQQQTTCNIPVIFVSAHMETERLAKESGADDFILKPFDIDDVITKVEKFIKSQN